MTLYLQKFIKQNAKILIFLGIYKLIKIFKVKVNLRKMIKKKIKIYRNLIFRNRILRMNRKVKKLMKNPLLVNQFYS